MEERSRGSQITYHGGCKVDHGVVGDAPKEIEAQIQCGRHTQDCRCDDSNSLVINDANLNKEQ